MTAIATVQEIQYAARRIIAAAERASVDPLTLSPDAITLAAAMLIACQRTGVPMTVADAITAARKEAAS
jgi:hypothetical protein